MEKKIGAELIKFMSIMLAMLFVCSTHRSMDVVQAETVQAIPLSESRTYEKQTIVAQSAGEETVLKLYRNHAEDSTGFQAGDLLPGDAVTHSYFLQVSYKDSITVQFHADICDGHEKLAEVLKCRISLADGKELYDGLMKDMPLALEYVLPQSKGTTVDLVYDITVYLDASVGNEYMGKELMADFRWWVNVGSHSGSTDEPNEPESPDKTDKTEDPSGELISPKTGDNSNILLWVVLAGTSVLVLILLFFFEKHKKEGEVYEQS